MSLQEVVFGAAPETRYRSAFAGAPHNHLLLTPDFTILDANRAYLQATMTDPGLIVRRPLFDLFPDNPGDPAADGLRNLRIAIWQRSGNRIRLGTCLLFSSLKTKIRLKSKSKEEA